MSLDTTIREYKTLFKTWRKQIILQNALPRFPNLMQLLASHFKEEMSIALQKTLLDKRTDKSINTKATRKSRLGKGFQKRQDVDATIPSETRIEKQLRKGIEAFKDINYFKAVCCYSKVS